jgi:hypothetical protein
MRNRSVRKPRQGVEKTMRVSVLRIAAAAAFSVLASVAVAQGIPGGVMRVSTDSSAASAADKTETRQAGKFSGIDLRAPADVVFSIGVSPSITVSGPADAVPLLLTSIHDDVLTIEFKEHVTLTSAVKVVITSPSLQAVNLAGSGSMTASGINGDSLNLNVSGSGSIVASGRVNTVNVAIHGSGGVDVHAVHANALNASVHGSGGLHGFASNAAIIDLSGSGDVQINGKPSTKIVHRSGSGDVSFE